MKALPALGVLLPEASHYMGSVGQRRAGMGGGKHRGTKETEPS